MKLSTLKIFIQRREIGYSRNWLLGALLICSAGMAGESGAQVPPAESRGTISRAEDEARTQVGLNFDWKFHLGEVRGAQDPQFDAAAWQVINVPHDWSVYGPFKEKVAQGMANGFRPRGIGWYRKTFISPTGGKRVFLDFEGVYTAADVWLNGTHLGKNYNGYLGFRFDITEQLKPAGGTNVLAVRADNTRVGSSRWYTGSGIYRNVNLLVVSPVHVPQYGVWITTPKIEDTRATVHIEAVVTNSSSAASDVTLVTEVRDPAGKQAAAENKIERVPAGGVCTFKQDLVVTQPQRWSTATPKLYKVVNRVTADSRLCDVVETTFGIRTIEFTPQQGLLVNGKKVTAKGVNFHHDLGCLGAAAFDRGFERRLELIKAMGCNAVRLAHNPYQPSLLDLCDRMGVLVIDEAYDKWNDQYTGPERPFAQAWPTDLRNFILRDRNHPSVFIWSVGNEEGQQMTAPDFGVFQFKAMAALVKSSDPTRAVTCGLFPARAKGVRYNAKPQALFEHSEPSEMAFAMDVVSCNYTQSFFERDHRKYPELIFLASEIGTNGGGDNWFEYDHAYTVGQFYWGGFDYIGESFGWPCKGWFRGLIDLAGVRKPASYYVESFYSEKPMVHIAVKDPQPGNNIVWNDVHLNWEFLASHWNWPAGQKMKVFTYSNGDTVELFLNGRSLGTQKMAAFKQMKMSWDIPFEPGTLKALAYRDGKVVAEHQLQTAGKACRLALESDRPALTADGLDLAHIAVKVVDQQGIRVPDATQKIHFVVTGAGTNAGVDNGNQNSSELWQADERSAYNGQALLVVRAQRQPGTIRIQATAEGLESAELKILAQ
ncbi:MAG: glycoside hydrolase family 2 protein [Verrucomicrobia bacterium]|nr:MAG: glycoside hydrolase family 2 protein [Verrucomicrobiota bacterium]